MGFIEVAYVYMVSSTLTITSATARQKKILIEIDAAQFERLAANLGLFNREFLQSLDRAEREVTQGRAKKLRNLKDLRRNVHD